MILPQLIAEVEFTPEVWSNVSQWVLGATTKRGKERYLDQINPGTLTLTLKNNDRRFDPEYVAGIHYGKLIPGKNVRLSGLWNGTTYPIFYGMLDSIGQRYNGPSSSTATFQCSDGLAALASASLGSPFEVYMATQSPRSWLRLGEVSGPYAFNRGIGASALHGNYGLAPTYGEPNLLFLDDDTSVKFEQLSTIYLQPGMVPPVAPMTISFAMVVSGAPTVEGYMLWDTRWPYGLIISMDNAGHILVKYKQINGVTWSTRSTVPLLGQYFLLTIVLETGQPARIYNRTIDITGATVGTVSVDAVWSAYHIGNWSPDGRIWVAPAYLGLDEFMTYDYALSAGDRALLYSAVTAWYEDNGNDRITRILNAVGWPVGLRDITTEFDGLLGATPLKESALDHLRALESTIEGRLFVEKDGTLRLLGRGEQLAGAYLISQATFGDGPGELGYKSMGDYGLDLALVTNVVRRSNTGTVSGNPQEPQETIITASDPASISAYKKRDQTDIAEVTSLYRHTNIEADLAEFRVNRFAQPIPHIDKLTIQGGSNPVGLWPQALGRELGDRITFVRRPQKIGPAINTEVIIEGIEHTISPGRWDTSFSIDAIGAKRYFMFDNTLWDAPDWRFSA